MFTIKYLQQSHNARFAVALHITYINKCRVCYSLEKKMYGTSAPLLSNFVHNLQASYLLARDNQKLLLLDISHTGILHFSSALVLKTCYQIV